MELKRPFSEEDWEATPKPVRQYIIQLEDIVIKLFNETQDLKKRVSDLENRLNKNSQNSSKPPSSDPPFKKPSKKRIKGKRKRGGQKGHKGHQQKLMEPSSEINLLPNTCGCGADIDPKTIRPFYVHQVIELPEIDMDVSHFILNEGSCSRCGCAVKAALPTEHRTGYGPRLSALIAEISGIQGNSRETVRTFCQSVFGFSISSGAIQKVIDRASQALKPVHEKIGDEARNSAANYIDETSWFQNGMLKWLWVMASNRLAYFMIHKNRSKQAFLELVQDWEGILISDNYGTYTKWANLRQTCLAHLIRKARGLADRKDPVVSRFGKQIARDLQLLCHWAKEFPDDQEWRDFYHRFTALIFNHQTSKGEVGTLARSLIRQIESLWLFLDIEEIEPTNNIAERALRYGVLWRKRSKGTQSTKGNRWVERILSFKQTCSIRSIDSYPLLVSLMESYFNGKEPNLSWI